MKTKHYSDQERETIRSVVGREETVTWDSDMLIFRNLCKDRAMFGLYLCSDPYWSRGQARYVKNELPFLSDRQVELFCVRGQFFTLTDKVWVLEFMTSHMSKGHDVLVRGCIFDREGQALYDNQNPELYRNIDYSITS